MCGAVQRCGVGGRETAKFADFVAWAGVQFLHKGSHTFAVTSGPIGYGLMALAELPQGAPWTMNVASAAGFDTCKRPSFCDLTCVSKLPKCWITGLFIAGLTIRASIFRHALKTKPSAPPDAAMSKDAGRAALYPDRCVVFMLPTPAAKLLG